MKKIVIIMLLTAMTFSFTGCDSKAKTGALVGTAAGAGAGQAIGRDTKGTLIGAAIGAGAGYIIGGQMDKSDGKKSDKKAVESPTSSTAPIEETIWITNSNGSQTPVKVIRIGDTYTGPKGETYSSRPTQEQLKTVYGF